MGHNTMIPLIMKLDLDLELLTYKHVYDMINNLNYNFMLNNYLNNK